MLFGFLRRKPSKYPAIEQRREVRHEAEDEFVLEFKASNSHYIGNSRDISVNGVRFVTTCKLKVKQDILLNFRFPAEFPGQKHISVHAKVVRVYQPRGTERYRIGCSLRHDTPATQQAISQFIYWLDLKSTQ